MLKRPPKLLIRDMRKYLIAVILVIAISAVLAAVFFGKGKDEASLSGAGVPAPVINPGLILNFPQEDHLIIGTPSGGITVKNFYRAAREIVEQTEVVLKETAGYIILYHAVGSDFELRILGRPPEDSRKEAEAELLRILGISQKDACKFNVSVSIPYDADPLLKGGDYPLSFCLGGGITQ